LLCSCYTLFNAKIPRKQFPRSILLISSRGCHPRMLRGNCFRGIMLKQAHVSANEWKVKRHIEQQQRRIQKQNLTQSMEVNYNDYSRHVR